MGNQILDCAAPIEKKRLLISSCPLDYPQWCRSPIYFRSIFPVDTRRVQKIKINFLLEIHVSKYNSNMSLNDIKKLFPRTEHARKMKAVHLEFFTFVESTCWAEHNEKMKEVNEEFFSFIDEGFSWGVEHNKKMKELNDEFKAFVKLTNVVWDFKERYYDDELYSSYAEYEQDGMTYEQWKFMRELAYDSD